MASEHVLTLKAQLDSSDVEAKLKSLGNGGGGGGGGGDGPAAGLERLGESVKELRRALGGGVAAKSMLRFAEAVGMLGEKGKYWAQELSKTVNDVAAAAATGNISLMLFVGALDLMSAKAGEAAEQAKEAAAGLAEFQQRIALFDQARQKARNDAEARKTGTLAAGGTDSQLREALYDLRERRQAAQGKVDRELRKGPTVEADVKGLQAAQAEVERLDGLIKTLEDALKARERAARAEADEIRDERERLREARSEFMIEEKDRLAAQRRDIDYFARAMAEARLQMEKATDEGSFSKFKARYNQARGQYEALWGERQRERDAIKDDDMTIKEPGAAAWADALRSIAGTPASGYTAAGFSMGEALNPTAAVEKQIDEVIRLLREQLQQELSQPLL